MQKGKPSQKRHNVRVCALGGSRPQVGKAAPEKPFSSAQRRYIFYSIGKADPPDPVSCQLRRQAQGGCDLLDQLHLGGEALYGRASVYGYHAGKLALFLAYAQVGLVFAGGKAPMNTPPIVPGFIGPCIHKFYTLPFEGGEVGSYQKVAYRLCQLPAQPQGSRLKRFFLHPAKFQ